MTLEWPTASRPIVLSEHSNSLVISDMFEEIFHTSMTGLCV